MSIPVNIRPAACGKLGMFSIKDIMPRSEKAPTWCRDSIELNVTLINHHTDFFQAWRSRAEVDISCLVEMRKHEKLELPLLAYERMVNQEIRIHDFIVLVCAGVKSIMTKDFRKSICRAVQDMVDAHDLLEADYYAQCRQFKDDILPPDWDAANPSTDDIQFDLQLFSAL